VRDAEIGRKHADKLVRVWSLQDEPFHVMIHIEVQSDKDLNFPKRMYIYNYRIFDKSYRPVTSPAILADEVNSWRPNGYTSEQFTQNLIAYEEEQKMPYVTSAERIGIEKGKLEGRSEGLDIGQLNEAREMVLEALDTKFSSNVPADIHKLIKDLNNRIILRKLLRSTIQSKDIEDFRKTLEEITAEDPA